MSRKVVLCILDGFGESPSPNPIPEGDAIKIAKTPNIDALRKAHPYSFLDACGESVGLLPGGMGGSEIGHVALGAGRVIPQFALMIKRSIENGSFFKNAALQSAVKHVKEDEHRSLHLLGMISDAGVHSDISHLYALLRLARQEKLTRVFIHCIADGRDVKKNVTSYLSALQEKIDEIGVGQVASVIGRFYAMDRDNNWDRTKVAYDLMVTGKGVKIEAKAKRSGKRSLVPELIENIEEYYKSSDDGDYYLPPMICVENGTIRNGDALIFFNYRTDRPRQLTSVFDKSDDFGEFEIQHDKTQVHFVAMGPYTSHAPVAFDMPRATNNLGDWLSQHNVKQLRVAETEKFAHVTFFFNSQNDEPSATEDRILVPSKKVESFAEKPEMSAAEITNEVVNAMNEQVYSVIIVNYANADLVGHSGKLQPTIKAIETLDSCIGRLTEQAEKSNHVLMITGDHGNAEDMIYADGTEKKSHSMNPVIFLLCDYSKSDNSTTTTARLRNGGLADVAPTLLQVIGLEKPKEMTGQSLLIP
uniref:phosphoglycerate mutase (2,3-diphosphoglycerate-independent) n=1 Tax=Aplanochytrium stocchinoi TaxID=215587 RepID=A0A6S8CFM1_9STRA|mmetsp:Transcript_30250/g.37375  ORF Transcript_30250/g.37375 Transcript_30250/m.37375 type:complete len:530 (+) Transcript_30250:219-1808(+)|eukprot:CAMPEP_0204825924 /NCGR_PEP_ID=MMETSP1346-20131115/3711_1 /ASSEMBLY_ACC=CAM_ASM_000771 /TAXON_ID=215587 /ORGANISM="Aplanochytrium stocchinoi, Strain GSBS06" /LENGTH=529 /DNA_ID=CAMNT_0051953719 /DNA_START=230 /DNA_END=1819 /DNA_ORIENTATION=+